MKKFVQFTAVLVLVLVFVSSCPNGASPTDEDGEIGSLKSVKNKNVRSLFTSNIPVNYGTSRNAEEPSEINTLSYVNDAGKNMPVVFLTSTDKELILQTLSTQQVDDRRLVAEYTAVYEVEVTSRDDMKIKDRILLSGKTLIDMETGRLYDFSAYRNPYYNSYGLTAPVYFSRRNTLFAITNYKTLHKIDLSNIGSAIPLNNPEYAPVNGISFVIGDKIICNVGDRIDQLGPKHSFDINNTFLPKPLLPYTISEYYIYGRPFEISDMTLSNGPNPPYFIDSNNDVWFFGFVHNGRDLFSHSVKCKLTIDDEGQLGISDYSEEALPFYISMAAIGSGGYLGTNSDGNARYYYRSRDGVDLDGFVAVRKNSSGVGITIEAVTTPLITIAKLANTPAIHDNFIYWTEGTSIKRMELSSNGTEETIYTNSSLVTTRKPVLSGDSIIFYQYLDATTVATYSLRLADLSAAPMIVSESTVEISSIMELNF